MHRPLVPVAAGSKAFAKRRCQAVWQNQAHPADKALNSNWLVTAQYQYADGFHADQNHFFSGLNALALLIVRIELAQFMPDKWAAQFDSDKEAESKLQALINDRQKLAPAVLHSIEAAFPRQERLSKHDVWLAISQADLRCLTISEPGGVQAAYAASLEGADPFAIASARGQLEIYRQLGILSENVNAALNAFPPVLIDGKQPPRPWVFLFTGHQIDAPDRKNPRFPAHREQATRKQIEETLKKELSHRDRPALGISGAASGGDILFHEACAALGIPSEVYLALPPSQFINASVAPAGGNRVARFHSLLKGKQPRQMAETEEMPRWFPERKPGYGICNATISGCFTMPSKSAAEISPSSPFGTVKAATAPEEPKTWSSRRNEWAHE